MIRVLVVHEQRLMASLIASVLADEDDIEVAGRATDAGAALAQATAADVLLISAGLPGKSALELVQRIVQEYPDKAVLALGVAEAEWEIMQYVKAGAAVRLIKPAALWAMQRITQPFPPGRRGSQAIGQ
jgi:DNA-binding NarL/FixJ family response regulator